MTIDRPAGNVQSPPLLDENQKQLTLPFIVLAICWSLFIAGLSFWEERQAYVMAKELARTDALSSFNKDLVYRRWATRHGGVYVPVTDATPANPYLAHIPARDLTMPSGRKLTLMNPAYMTRQVNELAKEQYGVHGHITSLKPLRPENNPDAWETKALQIFESGVKEISSLEMVGNELHLRLMRPMVTEDGCLKCHAQQGYKVGDIRGGISVSVPFKQYHDAVYLHSVAVLRGYAGIWVLGIGGLWVTRNRIQRLSLQRSQAERKLAERNQFIGSIVNLSPDMLYIYDLIDRENIYVNDGIHRILGYSKDEVQHMGDQLLVTLMHPEDFGTYVRETWPMYSQVKDNELIRHQYRMKLKNGEWHWLDCVEVIYKRESDGSPRQVLGVVHDINARKRDEERIQQSLKEKEVMLKEIHHRVKNNMQVIISLLNLQAKGIADEAVRAKFDESRNRVYSMALIHENLYHSADLSHVDFKAYLKNLISNIAETYKRRDVVFDLNMEPLALDVNVGIPCGLIVNELVSNCLKHAFPDGREGMIKLGISKNSEGSNVLSVSDNGIGFPETVDFRNTASLGMQLVTVLTGQIHGTIELFRAEGTTFRITFPGK